MTGMLTGARGGLRWGVIALAAAIAIVAIGSDPADARSRRKRHVSHYNPPYAAIVVDANSGRVLRAVNADAQRHPASITKIMTLYLLFEQIEAGRLKMDSELSVSPHAAAQAPSKLGVRPGQTIEVEDAIKAVVTKSANDVAVVIAEAVGGSESNFATMMTRKARALGMTRTTYVNASGLPDDRQITTARDQALLGRAVQERFPRY
jgi:D-alanyl-D-alanine carboxypeptidase